MSKQFANDNNARFKHSMIVKSILTKLLPPGNQAH